MTDKRRDPQIPESGSGEKTLYSKEQAKTAKSVFLQNDYWKEYCENAPSAECKEYVLFKFCFSLYGYDDEEAFRKYREKLEKQLDYWDLEWLYRHCGNNPERARWKKLMESR